MMRIGIDCRTILNPEQGEKAGIGHYTYFLVKHLLTLDRKNEYILYVDHTFHESSEFSKFSNVKITYLPFSRYKQYLPFWYAHVLISAQLKRDQLDVFHAPANVIPLYYKGTSVVTIHDLAIYKHPEWFPDGQEFSKKVLVPSSLERASQIIAVSQSTKRDILKLFQVPSKKVEVVYEGISPEQAPSSRADFQAVKNRYSLAPHYVYYVGVLEPRKNLPVLIKAFDDLVNKHWKKWKDWQLVIAGAKGWKYDEIMQAIKNAKCGSGIRYIGYVSHEEKMALLAGAQVFAFPTLWEGFGLPVLEAMSVGTPVLSSDLSSIPEIAEGAAELVNPRKLTEVQGALQRLMSDPDWRLELGKLGKARARRYTWTVTAQATLRIYERANKKSS